MKISTIRFNLKFFNADGGEEVVRTLDDLRSKFNLSDLYDYFKAGDLARWLTSINRQELAEAVVTVSGKTSSHDQVCGLRDVLNIPIDNTEVDQFVSLLERQNQFREKKSVPASSSKVGKSYMVLVDDVFVATDFLTIKKRLSVFTEDEVFEERFLRDVMYGGFYTSDGDVYILVMLAVLGHKQWRKYLYHIANIRLFYVANEKSTQKDYLLVRNSRGVKRRLEMHKFNGKLLNRCCRDRSNSHGRSFPEGTYTKESSVAESMYDQVFSIYDDLGNPSGCLGAMIDEFISW